METLQSILVAVVAFITVLSVVVFVHEFGHYQVARWCKVRIEAFSIGFGKELIAWTSRRTGVRWRISALPFGGYVKFEGDADAASTPDPNRERGGPDSGLIHDKPVWVRAAVTVAGPVYNFIFAILVFAAVFLVWGEGYMRPVVDQVNPGGAAARAGIVVGDEIVRVDGQRTRSDNDVRRIVMTSGGKPIEVVVQRAGQTVSYTVTPDVVARPTPFGDQETQGVLNVMLGGSTAENLVRIDYNPATALVRATERTWEIIDTQVRFIGALISGGMSAGHLSGPLGIGQTAGMVAESSAEAVGAEASFAERAESVAFGLIQLTAVLSIAIGFINLMPVPMLDGGHLVMYAIEAVRGKPLPDQVQIYAMRVGMFAVLALFLFATFQDIERLGLGRLLSGSGVTG